MLKGQWTKGRRDEGTKRRRDEETKHLLCFFVLSVLSGASGASVPVRPFRPVLLQIASGGNILRFMDKAENKDAARQKLNIKPSYAYHKTQDIIFRYDYSFPLRVTIEQPQTVTVLHRHDFCECVFVARGSGAHQSGNHSSVPISRGNVLVIPDGGYHAYTAASDDLVVINLLFDVHRLPSVLLELYNDASYKRIFMRKSDAYGQQDFPLTRLDEETFLELEGMLTNLARTSKEKGFHCYKLGLFMAIMAQLCNAWKVKATDAFEPLDIPRITAYLEQNFQRDIYLDELARLGCMSKATLLRHFHAALGVSPMVYIRNLRLRHAAELLLRTNFNLKEIANQSGFTQLPYFFKAFHDCYGVSPLEYRKKG